ncbi:phage holin [Raoultella ornithinolytica]|uniref:phage holin n=2 Tax=Klebsiella/Raoultella group TaxID=2890311 RepID=UPI003966F86E
MKMPDKIFSAASYCTSGGLICTGLARTFDWFHGLDWNFIALASGVIIGVATYLTNLYYKRRWTKMYQQSLDRGYGGPPNKLHSKTVSLSSINPLLPAAGWWLVPELDSSSNPNLSLRKNEPCRTL